MCILFVHTNPNPGQGKYRLILASNRDEYFHRPAEPAHRWPEDNDIIGGRDMEKGREGGTWLGMSLKPNNENERIVRVGALLNVTGEPRNPGATGRGCIVTDYLKDNKSLVDYIQHLKTDDKKFNAFSFVAVEVGKTAKVCYYSNVPDQIIEYDPDTIAAFGNSLPFEPLTKVKAGKERFRGIIEQFDDTAKQEELIDELMGLLKWEKKHLPDDELERRAPKIKEYLSAVCVSIPIAGYGTRTHSLVLVDWEGNVDFIEDTMKCPIDANNPEWIKMHIKARL